MCISLYNKYLYIIIILLNSTLFCFSQTKKIEGLVIDTNTNRPVPDATVEVLNFYPPKTTRTNVNGEFILTDIPVGKYKLLFKKKGYEDFVRNDVRVANTSNTQINQSLRKIKVKSQNKLSPSEILQQEFYNKKKEEEEADAKEILTFEDPEDNMVAVGHHNISSHSSYLSIGNRQDPVRLLSNHAGVMPLSDWQSSPIVRGNSPMGLQFRLEGLPIEMPIHLRNAKASNVGSSSLFSMNAIGKSSLLLGALNANYGNAIEGVFDIELRRTNTQRRISFMTEYSTASGIGLSIQGPLTREKYGSFVINYRYSAFNFVQYGIESALNLYQTTSEFKTAPILQDMSFKLDFPSREANQFSLFGVVSVSHQDMYGTDVSLSNNINKLNYLEDELFRTNYFLGGFIYKRSWGNGYKNYWKTVLGATYFTINNINEIRANATTKATPVFSNEDWNYSIKVNSTVLQHINPTLTYKGGILLDHNKYSFYDLYYENGRRDYGFKFNTATTLLQAHSQLKYQPLPNFQMTLGFNSNLFLAHIDIKDIALEPRFALQWDIAEKHQLGFAYGMHSQKLPAPLLFHLVEDNQGLNWQSNQELKTPIAHLLSLTYKFDFAERWRLKINGYYQYQTNIVVDSLQPTINYTHFGSQYYNYQLLQPAYLINLGHQHKIGADLSVEKYLGDGYYGLVAFSFVNVMASQNTTASKFKTPDFGAAITPKFVLGKAFRIGPIRRNHLKLELKFVYAYDNNTIPIDTLASISQQKTVFQYEQGFSERLPDYWRLDLKVAFVFRPRKNDEIFHDLSFEILNLANTKNVSGSYFNRATQNIQYRYQLPLYFDLLYRVRF